MRLPNAASAGLGEFAAVAVLLILIAGGLLKFADLREDARRSMVQATQGSFTAAVLIIHSKWATARSRGAREVPVQGGSVEVNALGWPHVDRANPEQDTTAKLYARVMQAPLQSPWRTCEIGSARLGDIGAFVLPGSGGGAFTYDGTTGTVAPGGSCP